MGVAREDTDTPTYDEWIADVDVAAVLVMIEDTKRCIAEEDDSFDQWVADEGGPEAVLAMIEDIRRQIDEGSLREFTDKEEFLAYMRCRSS